MYFPASPPVPVTDETVPIPSGGDSVGGFRFMAYAADGSLVYADNRNREHMTRLAGITLGDAMEGETIRVRRSGSVSDQTFTYNITKPLFLGQNGFLVQTAPTTGIVCNVGIVNAQNEIIIDIGTPTWVP